MKSKPFLFLLILLGTLLIYSCKKSTESASLQPSTWIESSTLADTLIFNDGLMTLNRPKEMKNGHMIPKWGAGLYLFNVTRDSINLKNMLSSSTTSYNYKFSVEGNKLYIEDFYLKGGTKIVTFERVR